MGESLFSELALLLYIVLGLIVVAGVTFLIWSSVGRKHLGIIKKRKPVREYIETLERRVESLERRIQVLAMPKSSPVASPSPKWAGSPAPSISADSRRLETSLRDDIEGIKVQIDLIKDQVRQIRGPEAPASTRYRFENSDVASQWRSSDDSSQIPSNSFSKRREEFFLPNPNEDGSFSANKAQSNYKEGASIYRFTKTADNAAEFQIDDRESSTQQALQYPETIIERVCTSENSRSEGEKRIVTLAPGRAELVDDKWKLVDKARIRYEH